MVLLPSCIDITSYLFLQVELLMGVVYASLLFSTFEEKQSKLFYYLKVTIYLFLLMILKNTGIIYTLLFWGFTLIFKNEEIKTSIKKKEFFTMMLLSSAPMIIWEIYCKAWDRINYFSAEGENLLKGVINKTYELSPGTNSLIISFFESLFIEPLHSDRTLFLDVSVILCVILTSILLWFAFRKRVSCKRRIIIYYLCTVIFLLAGLLWMHIFIFREPHYSYTSNMIYSIARYVEPIFLGNILLAFMLIIDDCNNQKRKKADIAAIIFTVLLCANYGAFYNRIINYYPIKENTISERLAISDANKELLSEIEKKAINGRILYVINNTYYFEDIEQRRLRYILSPASIIYQFVDTSIVGKEQNYSDILWQINRNHCQYIFFKEIPEEYLVLFNFKDHGPLSNEVLKIEEDLNGCIYFQSIDGDS